MQISTLSFLFLTTGFAVAVPFPNSDTIPAPADRTGAVEASETDLTAKKHNLFLTGKKTENDKPSSHLFSLFDDDDNNNQGGGRGNGKGRGGNDDEESDEHFFIDAGYPPITVPISDHLGNVQIEPQLDLNRGNDGNGDDYNDQYHYYRHDDDSSHLVKQDDMEEHVEEGKKKKRQVPKIPGLTDALPIKGLVKTLLPIANGGRILKV